MIDTTFFESFGSGAGGGFLGVLLGWWTLKSRLDAMGSQINAKAEKSDVDQLREISDDLVREKTCVAKTDGLARMMGEKIDGINSSLGSRVASLSERLDNSTHRFDRLDDKLDRMYEILLTPIAERKKKGLTE